jgi:hypothetical protein
VNAVTSTDAAEPIAPRRTARARSDRLLAALPLASVYVWLCVVYAVEAWSRVTPWLFGDELESTQLSRAIAATGHAARRGEPHPFGSLYTVMTAPLWLFDRVATAYDAIKYVDVLVMTSVVFPTYFLARLVVGRRAALFAAAGAGAIPSLAYSGYIVEENLAYPYAALCFFLIAKALVETRLRSGRRWAVVAAAACVVAPLVRSELTVIPGIAVLALLFAGWSTDWAKARRASWSIPDWIGVVLLVVGAIFLFSAVASHVSYRWWYATNYWKHRMLNMGDWAAGTLAIGIGVIPLSAGLSALFPARGEERTRELRMFRSVAAASILSFGIYTAMKATILSWNFATRVEERNLIYVAPLLFVGMALLLERRRVNVWAFAAASAFATYLVVYAMYYPSEYPYEMNVQLYSDALGLAILQQANRYIGWTPEFAREVLWAVSLGGTLLLAAVLALRRRVALSGALAAVLGAGVLGWSLTGQIAAATGSNSISQEAALTLRQPFSWVDDVTHGRPALYMGEGEADPNPENLLEFWNRSIVRVSSLDGTVQGPGPAGSPDLTAAGATLFDVTPSRPFGVQYAYAVEDYPCVDFAGKLVATHPHRAGGLIQLWRLIRLTRPNRIAGMCTGLYPDGWTGENDSSYFRFASGAGGWLRIVVSRRDWGGDTPPSPVDLLVGKIRMQDRQPTLGRIESRHTLTIASSQTKVVWLPTRSSRFAVHVVVKKKFVPALADPSLSDRRTLGAEVSYRFFGKLPRGVKP